MAGETEFTPQTPLLSALKPESTAAELEDLATNHDRAVRAAVAAHPNTPAEVLACLAADFPAEVLGNPGLPLLRLAQPRLLLNWPRDTLLRLVRHELSPDWLRRHALNHPRPEFQVALASNPTLGEQEVTQLTTHPFWQVRAKIASRSTLPTQVITNLTNDPDYGVRLYMAARHDLPPTSIQALQEDPSLYVRQVLEKAQQERKMMMDDRG